jgi:hypothetical protein
MLKKYLYLSIALLSLCIYQFTSAHFIQNSGNISVLLHIEPADNPGVNEISKLNFKLTDKDKKLDLRQCDCMIEIIQNSNIIFSENFNNKDIAFNNNTLSVQYIFPQKGIYTINIEGKPLIENKFNFFNASFDVRVQREKNNSISLFQRIKSSHFFHEGHWLHILLLGLGIVISLYIIKNKK